MANLESDIDPIETQEWLDALESVVKVDGAERAQFLLECLMAESGDLGAVGQALNTAYQNTISVAEQTPLPEEGDVVRRIGALIRWNAMAMVVRGGRKGTELGGHIASYASSAILYDIGFHHFFRGWDAENGPDLLYIQGHVSPGIYARAFLEGRLSEENLEHFREEINHDGLSSYPHPWLMPDFWQFPTVSMGLGPLQAIYQARFLKYLENRNEVKTAGRKVWAFLGDGEMDEPESLGAITIASREKLDNLVFVVNCNLQRLDGPVRGNSKIIQELEGVFRGAGWRVIKVVWGGNWDELLARDTSGLLLQRMQECVDGEYQNYKSKDGAYVRQHFFGKYPELLELVKDLTDEQIWALRRGGNDPQKVFAAYSEAMQTQDQPTVILAKTVKGYGMGSAGEGLNITHQQKKLNAEQVRAFRDRFNLPISDDDVDDVPFFHPGDDSPEVKYLHERRKALGGYLPERRVNNEALTIPKLDAFKAVLDGSGDREISTTMAFVRILNVLLKDKNISSRVVPIVPDECRTFGMEGLFRQIGIYAPEGQKYEPEDKSQIMYYREAKDGQMLEEGINEAGAFCSWIAAATSYSTNQHAMIPFYIYYSMFGFQRVGDLAWAAGDMRARGFLLGGTSGRTTLNGEGLQHQDGHSHVWAGTIPNCRTYDPTYAYELAVIMQYGLQDMYVDNNDVYYYLTVMNENYNQPAMPKGVEDGIIKGMYLLRESKAKHKTRVQLLGSGTILLSVLAAAEALEQKYNVAADVWSVTSFNELRREGMDFERYNRLNPTKKAKVPYVTQCLEKQVGPVIAATDYIRAYVDQIRAFVPQQYTVLGTDGFGRSDSRAALRRFFEVDEGSIVVAALKTLADEGTIDVKQVTAAIKDYDIDPAAAHPMER